MTNATTPEAPSCWNRPVIQATGAFLFFVVLALLAQRGGIRLSFDSFYYVEYAKEFRHRLPDAFGQSWPYGWPLVGSAGGLFGVSAYHTLLGAALLSVLALLAMSAHLLAEIGAGRNATWLVLAIGGGNSLLTALVSGVFSEVAFGAVLLGLAVSLQRWPQPGAILSSGVLALGALSLRYAGGLAYILLVLWLFVDSPVLRAARRQPLAIGTILVSVLLAALLLTWNRIATGQFSGAMPRNPVPAAEWPGIAANLGWALPNLVGGLFLRDLLGFNTGLRLSVGLLLLASMLLVGLHAALNRGSRPTRALGGLIVVYLAGLVALRCHSEFDDLYNGRMLFPVFFPLLLVAVRPAPIRSVFLVAGVMALAWNITLCLRGASLAVSADVRAAVPLAASVRWPERVLVNEHALTLTALVDAPVRRLRAPEITSAPAGTPAPVRYVVFAAPPADRSGRPAALEGDEQAAITRLLDSGYQLALETPALVMLRPGPEMPSPR